MFRAPASSLECGCFINNDEFLSGSDDGSIEHWSVLRKKPLHIVKNAHALVTPHTLEQSENERLANGQIGKVFKMSVASSNIGKFLVKPSAQDSFQFSCFHILSSGLNLAQLLLTW